MLPQRQPMSSSSEGMRERENARGAHVNLSCAPAASPSLQSYFPGSFHRHIHHPLRCSKHTNGFIDARYTQRGKEKRDRTHIRQHERLTCLPASPSLSLSLFTLFSHTLAAAFNSLPTCCSCCCRCYCSLSIALLHLRRPREQPHVAPKARARIRERKVAAADADVRLLLRKRGRDLKAARSQEQERDGERACV